MRPWSWWRWVRMAPASLAWRVIRTVAWWVLAGLWWVRARRMALWSMARVAMRRAVLVMAWRPVGFLSWSLLGNLKFCGGLLSCGSSRVHLNLVPLDRLIL